MASPTFLRSFRVSSPPTGSIWVTASTEHIIIGGDSKVSLYDFQGALVRSFNVSETGTYSGIAFYNNMIYRLVKGNTTLTLIPYSDVGAAGSALTVPYASSSTVGPRSSSQLRAIEITDDKLYITYRRGSNDDRVRDYDFPSMAIRSGNAFDLPVSGSFGSMSRRSGGFYFVPLSTGNVIATDTAFGRVEDDDIAQKSGAFYSSIGFNGFTYAIYDSFNSMIYLYGEETPTPEQPAGVVISDEPQYTLFQNVEERFDIVSLDADGGIDTVKVSNILGTRQTDTVFQVGDSVGAILSTILFTPKFTMSGIENGDILFLHSGDADEEPTQIPVLRWRIDGSNSVGNNYRQIFAATLVTA